MSKDNDYYNRQSRRDSAVISEICFGAILVICLIGAIVKMLHVAYGWFQ